MELNEIVARIASLIPIVDDSTEIQNHNRRNKRPYLKGAATLFEPQFTKELLRCWTATHPQELQHIHDEHPYPGTKETCDIVLVSSGEEVAFGEFEWAIEIKYLRLVGNNGNNNDYVLQKAISPFLKDRSLVHDIEKLRGATFAKRNAVIFYGFEYDEHSIQFAENMVHTIVDEMGVSERFVEMPEDLDELLRSDILPIPKNLGRVIRSVAKHGDEYTLGPITSVVDAYLKAKGEAALGPITSHFEGLSRHPCARFGRVVGWEI